MNALWAFLIGTCAINFCSFTINFYPDNPTLIINVWNPRADTIEHYEVFDVADLELCEKLILPTPPEDTTKRTLEEGEIVRQTWEEMKNAK